MNKDNTNISSKIISVGEILHCAVETEKHGWTPLRARILTERRIVAALDRAANTPDWWRVNRMHYYHPEISHQQIANLLGVSRQTVTHWINCVEILEDDYDALPPINKLEKTI